MPRGTGVILLPLLMLAACEGPPAAGGSPARNAAVADSRAPATSTGATAAPDSAALPPADAPQERALARADAAAKALAERLKARLMAVMAAEGAAAAVRVCADEAMGITAEVAREHGVRLGRASTRRRNPSNVGPQWVQEWLAAQAAAVDDAGAPAPVRGVIADGTTGAVARVLLPITLAEPCLVCHGPTSSIPVEVREVVAARYPADAATGFQPGDLRGALWAEADVPR